LRAHCKYKPTPNPTPKPNPQTSTPQDVEEGLVKRDLKRQKLQESRDTPTMVARMNELHDTTMTRRGKMMLPAPQVRLGAWLGGVGGKGWLWMG